MYKPALTKDEIEVLQQYLKYSPLVLVRLKSSTVLLKNKGMQVTDIAGVLGKSKKSITRWLKDFKQRRTACLFTNHSNNENASKLTKSQKLEISRVLQQPPSKYGLPREFWDPPTIKNYVKAEFGIVYVYKSVRSYHYLLKFSSLSFKYPDKFDIRRDEELIAKRMKEVHKELEPYWNNDNYLIFASDETRIQLEAVTRRAWLKKGEKTIIKVNRRREAQNYIGFLNLQSARCYIFRLKWQNQQEVVRGIKKLLAIKEYKNKKVIIVWDNAAFHKGKLIREQLQQKKALHQVHLINLPPYAPDKNPVEHVWKECKDRISNIQYKDFDTTKSKFEFYTKTGVFNYKI